MSEGIEEMEARGVTVPTPGGSLRVLLDQAGVPKAASVGRVLAKPRVCRAIEGLAPAE